MGLHFVTASDTLLDANRCAVYSTNKTFCSSLQLHYHCDRRYWQPMKWRHQNRGPACVSLGACITARTREFWTFWYDEPYRKAYVRYRVVSCDYVDCVVSQICVTILNCAMGLLNCSMKFKASRWIWVKTQTVYSEETARREGKNLFIIPASCQRCWFICKCRYIKNMLPS